MRHVTMTTPLSKVVCHPNAGSCHGQRMHQIEFSISIRNKDKKGDAKSNKWSGLR